MPITAQPAGTYENDDARRDAERHLVRSSSSARTRAARTPRLNARRLRRDLVQDQRDPLDHPARTTTPASRTSTSTASRRRRVDLYSATTKYQQVAYEATGLTETGAHPADRADRHQERQLHQHRDHAGRFRRPGHLRPGRPTALKATAIRTGAKLSWTQEPGHRRRPATGSSAGSPAPAPTSWSGTTTPGVTSFTDVGLADGASYTWTVVARDTSNNDSPRRSPAGLHQRRRPVRRLPAALRHLPDRDGDGLHPGPAALGDRRRPPRARSSGSTRAATAPSTTSPPRPPPATRCGSAGRGRP